MDEEKKNKILDSILDRTSFWIGNADAKASFLLSITGVILGFILSSTSIEGTIKYVYFHYNESKYQSIISILYIVCFVLSVLLITSALWSFLNALKGKVDHKKIRQYGLQKKSLLFWGDISKKKYQEYVDELGVATLDELTNDLNTQVYVNSIITTNKFAIYNKGIKFLKYGIILLVICKFLSLISIVST